MLCGVYPDRYDDNAPRRARPVGNRMANATAP